MRAGDNGGCNYLFSHAGKDASQPCPAMLTAYLHTELSTECIPGPTPGELGAYDFLFRAACDWDPYSQVCDGFREAIRLCPAFDAVAYESLRAVPGLVYLKPGKGHTTPAMGGRGGNDRDVWGDPATPFEFGQGSAGRCINAECKTSEPPASGISQLESGDAWCDSVADWDGMVWQSRSANSYCCEYEVDGVTDGDVFGVTCIGLCTKLGKGWGVCSAKPKLPGAGFDYNEELLKQLVSMQVPAILDRHHECG